MRRSQEPGSNLPLVFMVVIVVVMAVVVGFMIGNWMLGYLLGPRQMETVSYEPLLEEKVIRQDQLAEVAEYLDSSEIEEMTFEGTYLVQIGAFQDMANARSLVTELKGKGYLAFMTDGSPYRVQVGMFKTREEAQEMGRKLASEGYENFISR